MKALTFQGTHHISVNTLSADNVVPLAEYLSTRGSQNLEVLRS